MKLLKSVCGKAWLFDAQIQNGFVVAGLACFLAGCDAIIRIEHKGREMRILAPLKAIDSVVPVRVANARLAMQEEES